MSKLAFFDNECEKRIDGACLPWVEDDRILNANKKEWIHPDYEETIPVPPESLELCIRCWNPGFPLRSRGLSASRCWRLP